MWQPVAAAAAEATTKVAAEHLTADGHVDKLPRAAKSWKFVFFN